MGNLLYKKGMWELPLEEVESRNGVQLKKRRDVRSSEGYSVAKRDVYIEKG